MDKIYTDFNNFGINEPKCNNIVQYGNSLRNSRLTFASVVLIVDSEVMQHDNNTLKPIIMTTSRAILILFSALAILFTGCVEEIETGNKTGNQSPSVTPEVNLADSISIKAFDYINLDYPGLETVKEHYEKANVSVDSETSEITCDESELYLAAFELKEYFKTRAFVMPSYTFVNPNVSDEDFNRADQAIEHRFYIRNFVEEEVDGKKMYYLFPDKKDGKGVIEWAYIPSDLEYSQAEFKSQKFRHQWMLPQAMAYASTRDEKYVLSWVEVYGDFMNQFPCPEGKIDGSKDDPVSNAIIWKDLQVAERTLEQPAIIKYFINSENFTPGFLTQVLATYAEGVESLIVNPYYAPENNIYFSQISAITTACIMFPEYKRAADWAQYATEQIKSQLDLQFREDGVHNDLDPSYHMGTVSNFYSTYRLVQANGRSDIFPADQLAKLKNACRFMVDIAYPDYSLEYFNDTRKTSKSVLLKNYRWYAEMFPEDQEILWMSTEGVKGTEPAGRLITYPKGGYYMLRNGWKKESTMLVLKNNDNYADRWHCQPDNNTIGLYSNGRSFLPDAGAFSYGGNEQDEANRATYAATVMHNTLTSNGVTIAAPDRTRGKLLHTETAAGHSLIVTENPSYEGMSHRRAVFFVDNKFFVLVDEGYGNKAHTATLTFRLCDTKNDVVVDDKYGNDEYGVHTIFADNNNMIFKTFVETNDGYSTKSTTSYYSPEIGNKVQRRFYQVNIKKVADKAARFITVIHPLAAPDTFDAQKIEAEFTDNAAGAEGTFHQNGAAVKVTVNGKTYDLSYTLPTEN